MQKLIAFLIIISIGLTVSCSKSKLQHSSIDRIFALQAKAKLANNDSSLNYLKEAEPFFKYLVTPADSLQIEQLFLTGYYLRKAKKLDSAAIYFHKAIDRVNDTIQGKRTIIYFDNTWDNDFAIDHYTNGVSAAKKFIKIYKNTNNTKDLLLAYSYFEAIELRHGNLDKALFYNTKTQEMAQRSKNRDMSVNISASRATYLYNQNKKNEAYALMDSIANLPYKISPESYRQLFLRYGILKYKNNELNQAIINYQKALYHAKRDLGNTSYNKYIGWLYCNISEAYTDLKKYDLAKIFLDSSSVFVTKSSDSRLLSFFNKQRIIINYKSGESIKHILKDYDQLLIDQDKAYEERMNEELLALTSANKKEKLLAKQKQAAEITSLKSKNRFFYLLGFTLLSLIIAYFYNQQRKLKYQKQSIYMQQRLLRSQMNPHFISNILYTIQNNLDEKPEASKTYLTGFSRLLRLILENSMQNYVQINKELESLKKYMDLQLLRFPLKFSYTIVLNELEEDDLIFIPPMLIQPFVENSIEHGFMGIHEQGEITITLSKGEKFIDCSINDNGNGLSNNSDHNKRSVSSKLISDFIYKATKSKISIVNKTDLKDNSTGTQVQFLIPYKLTEDD